jgi:hypothetical protein
MAANLADWAVCRKITTASLEAILLGAQAAIALLFRRCCRGEACSEFGEVILNLLCKIGFHFRARRRRPQIQVSNGVIELPAEHVLIGSLEERASDLLFLIAGTIFGLELREVLR